MVYRTEPFLKATQVDAWLASLGDLQRFNEFASSCAELEQRGASPELAVVLLLRASAESAAEEHADRGSDRGRNCATLPSPSAR